MLIIGALITLRNVAFLSDSHYGFWPFQSTADFLIDVSDRVSRAFHRSWATRAVALDIFKAFDKA